jgi:NADP-dependent 3-hydroxy acid dehydrogenase YdfG
MKNKKLESAIVLIFETGEEFVATLTHFTKENRISSGHFTGIGAFSEASIGYFDWEKKDYPRNEVKEQVEVVSLVGDIALDEGSPKVHAHIVMGRRDGSAWAGHLMSGRVRPTLELVLGRSHGQTAASLRSGKRDCFDCSRFAMRKPVQPWIVVVTGASAGVGRATVRALAAEGAHVAAIARDTEGLHAAAREVDESGGKGLAVPADMADACQVEAAAARIESELGPIDVWVNNAMVTIFARVIDTTPDEFKRATEVTYLGTVGTMVALRRVWARNSGRIIQVGSALAYRSIPLQAAYCGAKHAIAGFTDSLRTELIQEPDQADYGSATGDEYPAIHVVPLENAAASSACAADLPARSGRGANRMGFPA